MSILLGKALSRLIVAAAVALLGGAVFAQDSVQVYLDRGADLIAEGNHQGALGEFQSALRLDHDNYLAIKNIGLIYAKTEDQQQAKVFLERAFKMNPVDAQVCNNLGVVFSEVSNSGEAIRYFESAVAIDSANDMYLTNLGQEYAKVGRIGQALPPLRAAWAINNKNPIISLNLGNCFAASKSYDSAEVYFQLAVRLGGRQAELYFRLGTVQSRLGKTQEAAESFEEALARRSDYLECRQALAILYLADKQFSAAAEHFGVIATKDSSFYPAWIGLGTAYALDGRNEESDAILSRLFAIDSTLGFKMLEYLSRQQSKDGP